MAPLARTALLGNRAISVRWRAERWATGWPARRARVRHGPVRPFGSDGKTRVAVITEPGWEAQEQVFPLWLHRAVVADELGLDVRELPVDRFRRNPKLLADPAQIVFLQCDWTGAVDHEQRDARRIALTEMFDLVKSVHPGARIVYMDWNAPAGLSFEDILVEGADCVLKRNLFRDRGAYREPTLGDTNLSDYFNRRFGFEAHEIHHPFPESLESRLCLGWNLGVSSDIVRLVRSGLPRLDDRPIDVQARFATRGHPWYAAARREADEAVSRLSNVTVARGPLSRPLFIRELERSKLCFSPFGYGEVCWRDFEAVARGAVLVKPDMSHIDTIPDIFEPYSTYVPVSWDLSDLDEQCRRLLADGEMRRRIAENAFDVLQRHLVEARVLDQLQQVVDFLDTVPPGSTVTGS